MHVAASAAALPPAKMKDSWNITLCKTCLRCKQKDALSSRKGFDVITRSLWGRPSQTRTEMLSASHPSVPGTGTRGPMTRHSASSAFDEGYGHF